MPHYLLPYTFSRDHLILASQEADGVWLAFSDDTPLSAIAEVQRHHAVAKFERAHTDELRERISQAYAA
ncbi:MAG: type II secretion system protein GspE, partial [Betaproteobacteria bacterium]|nr:type II secretion system protein GspE [Betaproteobacteria bacterium]